MKQTIKIARINGEYLDGERNCSEYINPYTGYGHGYWFLFDEAKKIFDLLNHQCLLKEDADIMPKYKKTRNQLELNVIEHLECDDKPFIYLFTVEIPKHIWDNREIFANDGGYDDAMDYINDYTNYHWKLEAERVIELPQTILDKYNMLPKRNSMNNTQKLQVVKNGMADLSNTAAKKIVRFLNWQERWDAALQVMHRNYKIETGEDMPLIGFAEFIYQNDKTLPKAYIEGLAAAN